MNPIPCPSPLLARRAKTSLSLPIPGPWSPTSMDIASGSVVGVTVTLIGFVLFGGPLRRGVARLRRTRLWSFTGEGTPC